MKKLILILRAMIISSVIFTGCGNSNSDKSSKTNEPSTTTKDSAIVSSAIENDNNYTSNAPVSFDEISGIYLSNENYVQDDLRGDEEQSRDPLPNIPFQKITIKKQNNKMTIQQAYQSDPGMAEGCDGSYYLKASAEIIGIKKLDDSIYILTIQKKQCNYHNGGEFACDGEIINIEEYIPKQNSDFSLTIDMKNNKRITMLSTAYKTKCIGAWDLKDYTFFKK
jgi:hypothetical protein